MVSNNFMPFILPGPAWCATAWCWRGRFQHWGTHKVDETGAAKRRPRYGEDWRQYVSHICFTAAVGCGRAPVCSGHSSPLPRPGENRRSKWSFPACRPFQCHHNPWHVWGLVIELVLLPWTKIAAMVGRLVLLMRIHLTRVCISPRIDDLADMLVADVLILTIKSRGVWILEYMN